MATVRKRKNNYEVSVSNGTLPNGSPNRVSATFTPDPTKTKRQNEKDLEAFVVDFEREVKSGRYTGADRMTFSKLTKRYLNDVDPKNNGEYALEKTTWNHYDSTLEQRILPKLGPLKLEQITPKVIRDYQTTLRKNGIRKDGKSGPLSDSTIRKDTAIISSILSYAAAEGILTINPLIYAGRQKQRRKTHTEYKVKTFTIDQIKWLLWALDNPIEVRRKKHERVNKNGTKYTVPEYTQTWELSLMWRAYFYLALFIADRRGENISLKWNHINFDTGEVTIEDSTAYTRGEIYTKDTKTHTSRTVIIPPVVISILKKWKKEQKQLCVELGTKWQGSRGDKFNENFVFIQSTGKQIHPSTPYHKFKKIIKVYNENIAKSTDDCLPKDATQHDLRHTAASILIGNKMDPRSVAGVLGHSTPSTTLNIYSYFFRTSNQEAADIMSSTLIEAK